MTVDRDTWPKTWMNVARDISQRSYDPRLKVGAIIVCADNTQVLSVGYNGSYRGGPNKPESSEPGKSQFIHAELNACIKCDYHFPKEKYMYVTHSPCPDCSRLIINAGIVRVIYDQLYRDVSGLKLMEQVGIGVYHIDDAIKLVSQGKF